MKKKLGSLLVAMGVISLVAYILKDIDFGEVWRLFGEVDLRMFFLAFIIFGFGFLIWNFRWQNSLKDLQQVRYWVLIRYLFTGIFFNTITPGAAVGGEPVRAYLLGKNYNQPKSKFFGVILADQSFHIMGFVVYFILSLIFIVFFLNIALAYKITFGVILAILLALIFGFIYIVFNKFSGKSKWIPNFIYYWFRIIRRKFKTKKEFQEYLASKFEEVGERFRGVVRDKKKFVIGIFASLLFQACIFTASYVLFLSLNYEINYLFVIVALSVGYFFGDISPSPGGIGILEAAVLVIYSALGVNPEIALSVALLDRVIALFYRLGIGGIATLSFSERISYLLKFSQKSSENGEFPK